EENSHDWREAPPDGRCRPVVGGIGFGATAATGAAGLGRQRQEALRILRLLPVPQPRRTGGGCYGSAPCSRAFALPGLHPAGAASPLRDAALRGGDRHRPAGRRHLRLPADDPEAAGSEDDPAAELARRLPLPQGGEGLLDWRRLARRCAVLTPRLVSLAAGGGRRAAPT